MYPYVITQEAKPPSVNVTVLWPGFHLEKSSDLHYPLTSTFPPPQRPGYEQVVPRGSCNLKCVSDIPYAGEFQNEECTKWFHIKCVISPDIASSVQWHCSCCSCIAYWIEV